MTYSIRTINEAGELTAQGCWGGENADGIATEQEARESATHLSNLYPGCDWVVLDEDGFEVWRYEGEEVTP